jgi:hypothetical protein
MSGMALYNQSDLPAFFSPRKVNLKNSCHFWLTTSRNGSSQEGGFMLLVSSNPLLRFWLGVSWDLANLGKLSSGAILDKFPSGIWQLAVSPIPELLGWEGCGG